MSNIDWDKEGGTDFQVYLEGTYKVSIKDTEIVKASTGTLQVRWKATILEPAELNGKVITTHTPLTEKALWKIARLVKACGVDLKSLGKMEIGSAAFLKVLGTCEGRTTYWHLEIELDNKGRDRNNVDDFRNDIDQANDDPAMGDVDEDVPEFLKG